MMRRSTTEQPRRYTLTASAGRSSSKRKPPSAMPRTITKIGQWNSIYKSSLHARGRKGAYEKGLGDLPRHRYSRRIYAGVCKTSANRGWRCRNCFPGHNNLHGRRLHHKTARDADRRQTVLYHVCISGRTFRNADGQADCLHRRGTGKGSAQRIKFS